jgi:hypothetical protein
MMAMMRRFWPGDTWVRRRRFAVGNRRAIRFRFVGNHRVIATAFNEFQFHII